jgi:anti-sigma factor ChrR (cupin superfamily)
MISPHVDALLYDLELGTLAESDRHEVERHLGACPACAAERGAVRETLASLAVTLPSAMPGDHVRGSLLEAAAGPLRFAPFTARIGQLFDLDDAGATVLVEKITHPEAWRSGEIPGMRFAGVRGGPRIAGATACFLAADPGVRYPLHRHRGQESVLVMQGSFREDDGTMQRAGDLVHMADGSAHGFVITGDEPCVCAYVVERGYEICGA